MKKILQKICTVALSVAAVAGIGIAARTLAPDIAMADASPASPDKTAPAPTPRLRTPQLRAEAAPLIDYDFKSVTSYVLSQNWAYAYGNSNHSMQKYSTGVTFNIAGALSNSDTFTYATKLNFDTEKEYTAILGLSGSTGSLKFNLQLSTYSTIAGFNDQLSGNELINLTSEDSEYKLTFKPKSASGFIRLLFTDWNSTGEVNISTFKLVEGVVGGGEDPDPIDPDPEPDPEPVVQYIKDTKVESLPYQPNLETEIDQFTIVKHATNTWDWNSVNKAISISSSFGGNQTNDWFITPGIKMETGKTYGIDFTVWVNSASCVEPLTVKCGEGIGKTAEYLNTTLFEKQWINWNKDDKRQISCEFTCEKTGYYNIGFLSDNNTSSGYGLYLNNIKVEELVAAAPCAPTNVETKRTDGSVMIYWDPVEKNTAGNNIHGVSYTVEQNIVGSDEWEQLASTDSNFYTYIPESDGFYRYRVKPTCNGMDGDYTESNVVYAGAPLTELNETFENGLNAYPWYFEANGSQSWSVSGDYVGDDHVNSLKFVLSTQEGSLAQVELYSGVYSLSGIDLPYLDFDLIQGGEDDKYPYVMLYYKDADNTNDSWHQVGNWNYAELNEWKTFGFDLAAAKGKNVQFKFEVASYNYANLYLDNVRIYDHPVVPELQTPYIPDFINTPEDRYAMTIVRNSQNSAPEWDDENKAWHLSSYSGPSDDWLITPGIYMEEGEKYLVYFTAYSSNTGSPEKLEVKYGNGANVAALTTELYPKTDLSWGENSSYALIKKEIICEKTGNYNFGFHSCVTSKYGNYHMYIKNIKIIHMVGDGTPLAPTSVKAKRGEQIGEVSVEWSPVTNTDFGVNITPEYNLERLENGEWVSVANNISTTSYTDNIESDGTQKFLVYRVWAVTGESMGDMTESNMVVVGDPIQGGIEEGFDEGSSKYPWYFDSSSYGTWNVTNDKAADENGYSLMVNADSGKHSYLYSAIYSLEGFEVPVFEAKLLSLYNYSSVNVEVIDVDNPYAYWTNVFYTIPANIWKENTWGVASGRLADYAGKNVQFRITISDGLYPIYIDDIRLHEYEEEKIVPPYEPDFSDPSERDKMTHIDGGDRSTSNDDYKTWQWNADKKAWHIKSYNAGALTSDDWMFTPSIYLEEGERYTLEFNIYKATETQSYCENVAVKYGKGANIDAMEKVLMPLETINWYSDNQNANKHFEFVCEETGNYNFGFWNSSSDADGVYLKEIKIKQVPAIPCEPANVVAKRGENNGEVVLSWDEVTSAKSGKDIESVTYNVERYNVNGYWESVASNIEETSITDNVSIDDNAFYRYQVKAVYVDQQSDFVQSEIVYVGEILTELNETFSNFSESNNNWFMDNLKSDGYWTENTEYSADGDGHSLKSIFYQHGSTNYMYSAIYSLADMVCPALEVKVLNDDNYSELRVDFIDIDDIEAGWKYGFNLTPVYVASTDEWAIGTVDLSDYIGKNVQFRFTARSYGKDLYLDDIRLYDVPEYDLLPHVSAPAEAKAGESFNVNVEVTNRGRSTAENVVVKLYEVVNDEDQLIDTQTVDVNVSSPATVDFEVGMSKLQLEPMRMYAEVEFAEDATKDNNTTSVVVVEPEHNNYAAPGNLRANHVKWEDTGNEGIWLEWDHAQQGQKPVVESFESGEDMATEFNGWNFESKNEYQIPTFWKASNTNTSVYIWNTKNHADIPSNRNYDNTPHNGDTFLMMIGTGSNAHPLTENWARSPELSGDAQIISFWVNTSTNTGQYGYDDRLSVLYYDSNEMEYKVCEGFNSVKINNGWTKHSVELPEGAKYFAFKHTNGTNEALYLAIDDVTYVPKDASYVNAPRRAAAEYAGDHLGYNVYRDGELLTETPTQASTYHDLGAVMNTEHTYHVTAAYAQEGENGETTTVESKPQSVAYVMTPDNITTGMSGVVYEFTGEDMIFTLDGVRIDRENLQPGVYVVVRNGKSQKIVVK